MVDGTDCRLIYVGIIKDVGKQFRETLDCISILCRIFP